MAGEEDGSLSAGTASNTIVIAVTERRTRAEIEAFATAFGKAAR